MEALRITIIIFFILGAIIIIRKYNAHYKLTMEQERLKVEELENQRLEKERLELELAEAQRIKDKILLEEKKHEIYGSNKEFESFIVYTNGFFNNNKLLVWKDKASSLFQVLTNINYEKSKIDEGFILEIRKFKNYYNNCEKIRSEYNQKYVENELKECSSLLSDIEGQSLDEQQRLAIVKDEDNNLVIAGAGSGKTTTVAGKVKHVIERFKIKPEEILLITFTKKASEEMKHRIKHKMGIHIDVNTFHSFGRKVIGEATNDMPSVIEDKQFYSEMKNIFTSLFNDPIFASKVIRFITEFRLESKDVNQFKNHGEYVNYIKENNIRSYKVVETYIGGKKTLLREICKSEEEVKIANYLFLNGVNYKYEEPYKFKTSDNIYAQYKPDFYLPDYDIYIEHFGLTDRNNNVPSWFSSSNSTSAKEKYNSGIIWKRETHANYGTLLIETYSYENKEGNLLENLKAKLEDHQVVIKQRSNEEIWKILNSVAKDEVSALDTLISTFLNLFKSNNVEISSLREQIERYEDKTVRTRYSLFLEIFSPILDRYSDYLKNNNLIDFSDMINAAANHIRNNIFNNPFKYIIIDEFQDTSIGRYNLIDALLKNNRACKLFAVGDDWQSIYRFAGSDISLFTQFENHFGITEVSKIETTYRFSKSMIDISSKFILANPNQTPKQLQSFTNDTLSPIEIIESGSLKNDDPIPFIRALERIDKETKKNTKNFKILALARYNHIIELYKERADLFAVKYDQSEKSYFITYLELPHLLVQFLSVHKSKGLQGDYVILLNVVSGQYGFPSEQADDPILNLLLSKSDQFQNGEERRLFYVALTRSKTKTFITTNTVYKSKFINEIDSAFIEEQKNFCPVCKKGKKVKQSGINKNGNPYTKYSCSNWKFGCDYFEWG